MALPFLSLFQVVFLMEMVCCCTTYDLEQRMTQVAQSLRTTDVESLFYFVRLEELSSRFGVELPLSMDLLRCSMIRSTYNDPKEQLMARFVSRRLKCPGLSSSVTPLRTDDPELTYLYILQHDDVDANEVRLVG